MHDKYKLDEKDRKILLELDKNARAPDSEIAKKVQVSKQVANYRIKKLIQEEIINNFYTIVNVGKLGFTSYYVFVQFQNVNEKTEKELLNKIKNKSYVGWLISGTGRWDAVLLVYANSLSNFDNYLNEILKLCRDKVHEYTFTNLITAEHIGYKLLGQNQTNSAKQTEKEEKIELDIIDKKIIKTISQNARLSTVEISEKTKIPLHVVRYRLKELQKLKLIENFKPKINIDKLGFQWHLLLIQFNPINIEKKKALIEFCKKNSKIYYSIGTKYP